MINDQQDHVGLRRNKDFHFDLKSIIRLTQPTILRIYLISRTNQEVGSLPQQQQLLQIIETILVYKFPRMDIQEIQQMFGLSELKQTRVYQQAFAEGIEEGEQKGRQEGEQKGRQEGELRGKLLAVPAMLAAGLTVEQIAQALDLSVDDVIKAAQLGN
jgi:predicted transposase/invertase (TIGR01784 family)